MPGSGGVGTNVSLCISCAVSGFRICAPPYEPSARWAIMNLPMSSPLDDSEPAGAPTTNSKGLGSWEAWT